MNDYSLFAPLYSIFQLTFLVQSFSVGPLSQAVYQGPAISSVSSLFLMQELSANLATILYWLLFNSTSSHCRKVHFSKQSKSNQAEMSPLADNTDIQNSSIFSGLVLFMLIFFTSYPELQSSFSTLIPETAELILVQMGCFNNSYLSLRRFSYSQSQSLSLASCSLRCRMAFHVSFSPSSSDPAILSSICFNNIEWSSSSQANSSTSSKSYGSSSNSSSSQLELSSFLLFFLGCALLPIQNQYQLIQINLNASNESIY